MKDTSSRKEEHLEICSQEEVSSTHSNYWDNIELAHCAAPEINFEDIDLRSSFLGMDFDCPLLISSMTGGSEGGEKVNETLARLAEEMNIPMGVGSQRVLLENRDSNFFSLRKVAPKAKLFANLGAVQLNYGVSSDDCKWLIDKLEANAFILHWNPLQEAIQGEGDRNFSELFKKVLELKKTLPVPLIVKEVGCGLDPRTAIRLVECGADAVDVAGKGGTHWGYIEGLRDSNRFELAKLFRNWGIDTPTLTQLLRQALPQGTPLIASGGIRSGVDVAKALSLGADMAGMALPLLKAAQKSEASAREFLELQKEALRVSMFCLGKLNIKDLVNEEV